MITMAVNKVVYNNETLIDLTNDTITTNDLIKGVIAHDKSGTQINGNLIIRTVYTGSEKPSDSVGTDGDIYLVL